jgi:dynein heavy chain
MALTGQSFDLDTFTLGSVFAMQLHKFKEDIVKVTSAALRELTIENELKKLGATWQEQRFELHRYQSVSFDKGRAIWCHSCSLPSVCTHPRSCSANPEV